jgi:hypothetical protein
MDTADDRRSRENTISWRPDALISPQLVLANRDTGHRIDTKNPAASIGNRALFTAPTVNDSSSQQ